MYHSGRGVRAGARASRPSARTHAWSRERAAGVDDEQVAHTEPTREIPEVVKPPPLPCRPPSTRQPLGRKPRRVDAQARLGRSTDTSGSLSAIRDGTNLGHPLCLATVPGARERLYDGSGGRTRCDQVGVQAARAAFFRRNRPSEALRRRKIEKSALRRRYGLARVEFLRHFFSRSCPPGLVRDNRPRRSRLVHRPLLARKQKEVGHAQV